MENESTKNLEQGTKTEEKKTEEAPAKDHFGFVDSAFEGSKKGHEIVDGLLVHTGKYKNPILFTIVVCFLLTMSGREEMAKFAGYILLGIISLKFVFERGDGYMRKKANKVVDIGVNKANKIIEERKAKKELEKADKK